MYQSFVSLQRKNYRSQLESMLVSHVFPEFRSPLGHLRARACCMIHQFAEVKFSDDAHLQFVLQEVSVSILLLVVYCSQLNIVEFVQYCRAPYM